jgi:hypothetical protein
MGSKALWWCYPKLAVQSFTVLGSLIRAYIPTLPYSEFKRIFECSKDLEDDGYFKDRKEASQKWLGKINKPLLEKEPSGAVGQKRL